MLKVASTGDSHFDSTSPRWVECKRIHSWMAADMRERGVSLLCHNGDWFERASKAADRNAVCAWLQEVADFADVRGVRGNHDAIGDLLLFNQVKASHSIYIEEAVSVQIINGCAVACVAWPRKSELLAQLGREVGKEESDQILRSLIRNLMLGLRDQLAQHEGPRIVSIHAMVSGAVTSVGQPLIGSDMEISLEEVALTEADIIFMSHIHRPQAFSFNSIPILYIGSSFATTWGELEQKSYVVAEFNDKRNEKGKILRQWYNVRTPRTPMVLLEGHYSPEHGEIVLTIPETERTLINDADVRMRYTVNSDHAAVAKSAAGRYRQVLIEQGAAVVKIEDVVNTTTRARAPEVTEARSLTDKLEVLWKVRELKVTADRKERLFTKTRELETEIGGIAAQGAVASVRLNSFRFKGFGPYKNEVFVDLDQMSGPLVAVTGPTGAGKTTMLGLALPGAIYREVPTYGSLKSIATDRNAYLESTITNGARYTIRQMVDAVSEKGEALVTDVAGKPLNTSGKLPEFDRWSAGHFPTSEVFYSSIFTAQAYSGFLGLKPGARKAVLLRALGIEVYEQLAENARGRMNAVKQNVVAAESALAALMPMVDTFNARDKADAIAAKQFDVVMNIQHRGFEYWRREYSSRITAEAETESGRAKGELTRSDYALVQARAVLAKAESEARAASDEYTRVEALLAQRRDLEAKLWSETASLTEIVERIEGNSWLITRAEAIRNAVARSAELVKLIEESRTALEALHRQHDGFARDGQKHGAQVATLTQSIEAHDRSVTRIMARLAKKGQVEKAKAEIEVSRARLVGAQTTFQEAQAECERLSALSLASAEDRAKALLGGHEQIMQMVASDAVGLAQDSISEPAIKANVAAIELAKSLPTQKRVAAARRDEAEGAVRSKERIVKEVEHVLASESDITAAETELAQVTQERESAVAARAEQIALEKAANLNASDLQSQIDTATPALQKLIEEKISVGEDAQYSEKLASAEARLEELKPQKESREAELARLISEIQKIEVKETRGIPVLTDEQNAVTTAEASARDAASAVALATQALAAARETTARIVERQTESSRLSEEMGDWTRLAEDLGRNGLQGLEIDASGPELNAIVNDLLRSCFGSRFTVEIETTRKDASGKKQIEGVFITVTDNEKGRIAPGEEYSGGEKVVIGEAISLSLTRLSCRRSGVDQCTLVRDETAGALDENLAPRYVEMLRRAASPEILNASKILFVAHNSALHSLADSEIHIEPGGVVTVR